MLSINFLCNLSLCNSFISLSSTITNNKIMWSPLAYAYPSMTNTFNNNKDYNFIKINLNNNNNMGLNLLLSYLYYPKAWVLKSNNSVMRLTNYSMPRGERNDDGCVGIYIRQSNCGGHWLRRGRGITARC